MGLGKESSFLKKIFVRASEWQQYKLPLKIWLEHRVAHRVKLSFFFVCPQLKMGFMTDSFCTSGLWKMFLSC